MLLRITAIMRIPLQHASLAEPQFGPWLIWLITEMTKNDQLCLPEHPENVCKPVVFSALDGTSICKARSVQSLEPTFFQAEKNSKRKQSWTTRIKVTKQKTSAEPATARPCIPASRKHARNYNCPREQQPLQICLHGVHIGNQE